MGERKVLNKYYPPDFDPAKIPRRKQPKNQQIKVRMMLPMSIRCGTCGTYIYKGTKFNSRKEDCIGETYLGIQIFRFYFKCTRCSAEITFKTDPQNSDYTVESGASRNFEPWRAEDEVSCGQREEKTRSGGDGDAMRALENRANDSKQDMDILAALEEMRSMKNSKDYVKRIDDDDDDDEEFGIPGQSSVTGKTNGSSESVLNPTDVLTTTNGPESTNKEVKKTVASKMPKFIVKPKPTAANPLKKQKTESAAVQDNGKAPVAAEEKSGASEEKTNVLQSLCQYASDESDD
ncbi:hypothetical protein ACQ4PT_070156 [Festuca glaucescens]